MKRGIRASLSRSEVENVLIRWVRSQFKSEIPDNFTDVSVVFSGENKYLGEHPKELRCRDCGSQAIGRTRRLPFDEATVCIDEAKENEPARD